MDGSSIEFMRYNPALKKEWDEFVESSKNGTFLFKRPYLEYHRHRFQDYSLLIYRKGKLYCLLPANFEGTTLYSHQGLTYGGLIMSEKCSAEGIMDVFNFLKIYLKNVGFEKFIYMPVPYIYHNIPAQEDLYALFRNNAELIVRNISSTIYNKKRITFTRERKNSILKAENAGLEVECSNDFADFWPILEQNLRLKYDSYPVHSLDEIMLLKNLFPDNIKLYVAKRNNALLGGVVIFLTENVVHTQYISASEEGKKGGAIDIIINYLLETYKDREYFDLGTSNESQGRFLNLGLIHQKEGFGGRGVCYDTYELKLGD